MLIKFVRIWPPVSTSQRDPYLTDMPYTPTHIPDLLILEPKVFGDVHG